MHLRIEGRTTWGEGSALGCPPPIAKDGLKLGRCLLHRDRLARPLGSHEATTSSRCGSTQRRSQATNTSDDMVAMGAERSSELEV